MTEGASMPGRGEPLPPEWPVERALHAYFDENGFTFESYDAARTPANFLGFYFTVPNTPHHRWAIRLHDLHHVATGYGTDPVGEGELAAWECRRGLRPLGLYTGMIVSSAVAVGLLIAPLRTLQAWSRSGRSGAASLFHRNDLDFDRARQMNLGDLRRELGVVPAGDAPRGDGDRRRGTHSLAPPSSSPLPAAWPVFWPLLLPLCYGLHLLEEVYGGAGFVAWAREYLQQDFTQERFVAINRVAWPLVAFAAAVAAGLRRVFLPTAMSLLFGLNGLLHLGSTLYFGAYSPGAVTGVLLYFPLTFTAVVRSHPRLGWSGMLKALIAAILGHGLVIRLAFGS